MTDLILSNQEIYDITHYRRPYEQLRKLKEMGIPATRLHDNMVRVLRMHLIHPTAIAATSPGPQRKSVRT